MDLSDRLLYSTGPPAGIRTTVVHVCMLGGGGGENLCVQQDLSAHHATENVSCMEMRATVNERG